MARQIVCRCRSPPSSPSHATFVAYNRSSQRSKQPPPSAMHGRLRVPEPSVPHGSELPERTCSLSCLSWLHLLKSWSLRQSRGGSDALKQTVVLSRTKVPIKVDDATSIIEISSVGTKLVYRLVTTVYDADFAAVKVN